MPLAPFVHRWRLLAAVLVLAAAVATPVFAQGERQNVMYILMGDNYFLPASVTVRAPTTVVWINQGTTVHSVRSGNWDSGPMVPGQAFWRIFTMPGEFWFTDPTYTEDGMSGYVTLQVNPIVATRTPQGGPRITQPQPNQAPQAPGATTGPAATGPAPIISPAPAVSPGPDANTPAALASPIPGVATAGVTGPPATGPGGAAPGGTGTAPLTGPAPASSPGPDSSTPAALSSPVPGAATAGVTGPRSVAPQSLAPQDPASLPVPEGRSLPTDEGAGFPLPLLGGGLVILGLVSSRWLRRP
jgi:plastocyanin